MRRLLRNLYDMDEKNEQVFVSQIDKNQGGMILDDKAATSKPAADPMLEMAIQKIVDSDMINGKIEAYFCELTDSLKDKVEKLGEKNHYDTV